jgi:hypothetical protein
MLIEHVLPTPGLTLLNAPGKTGKTILAAQIGMSVAAGHHLFDYYRTLKQGPVLFIEKDDPSGAASIRDIEAKTAIELTGKPFLTVHTDDAREMVFTDEFFAWLDEYMAAEGIVLVCLDSYTALRGERRGGGDFVKAETSELGLLDQVGKKHAASMLLNHHNSKGSANLDWSERAGGSYAVLAAQEAQIALTRFRDMGGARERLLRCRGRHGEDLEAVLRFNPDTLGFDHVLEGEAASLYPEMKLIKTLIGAKDFSPKEFCAETGMARATATRLIGRLSAAGALTKLAFGNYKLAPGLDI